MTVEEFERLPGKDGIQELLPHCPQPDIAVIHPEQPLSREAGSPALH